ncbi:hypothetical protein [Dactylosporangium sp. CA-092794]|uniref:hypothetical protein n=1 Tax=Dactylosporangium sp. CA-092794 TaxID=3239929 RepID=UPI003D8F0CE5
MVTLTDEDLAGATAVVRRELAARIATHATGRPGQALAAELFELIVSQSILPILVTLTSTRLSEYLQERRLNRLKRNEAEQAARSLVGLPVHPDAAPDAEALAELRKLLVPLGLSEQDIEALIDLVRQQIQADGES